MKTIRLILIAAALLMIYACIMVVTIQPWFIVLFAILAIRSAGKRASRLWACGTAKWATAEDLKGMIDEN